MIRCRECGKEISENATTCPNCGRKTWTAGKREQNNKENEAEIIVGIVASVIDMILIIAGFCIMNSDMNKWYGGYNYRFPWEPHECLIIGMIVVGVWGLISHVRKMMKTFNNKL